MRLFKLLLPIFTLAEIETKKFDSDVNKVMDILVHSLYKTKDIFLRELVSNSADALEKIRIGNDDLAIKIKSVGDKLIIEDNGVGMTRDELVSNLGTIANSGTSKLVENPDLIGKFGVGFYSVFLVSDNVTVTTKSDQGEQFVWKSDSKSYTLEKGNDDDLKRGTRIELKLRENAQEFGDPEVLEQVLKKHSEFVKFPIYLWKEKQVESQATKETSSESKEAKDEDEVVVEDVPETETKKEPEFVTVADWERVNSQKPIWLRNPSKVTQEEYDDFFKQHYKESKKPLKVGHFKIEGQNSFNVLMFIPESAPKQFLSPDNEKTKNQIELFVRRVFISDEFVGFLPNWLSFVKVVLDSDDLPLNVNREHIQTHASLKLVQKKIVSKALDLLQEVAEKDEDYKEVYDNYGRAFKVGIHESRDVASHQAKLMDLIRFESTTNKFTSLKAYKERMIKDQKQIYFSTGTSLKAARGSPMAERLMTKGVEVLLFVDPVDEYLAVNDMKQYDSIPLQDVAKPGVLFDDEDKDELELLTKKYEPLIKYFKQTFDTKLADVKLSLQLASTAAIILPGQIGMSPMQEKMFVLQNQGKENDPMYKMYLEVKKTLELNPNNPIVKKMLEMVESNDSKLENLAKFFYDVQFIASGWEVRQPRGISLRADRLIRDYLNLEQEQTYSTMDTEVDGNSDAEVNKAADAKIEQKEDEFNSEL